jgi:hypothetical protein
MVGGKRDSLRSRFRTRHVAGTNALDLQPVEHHGARNPHEKGLVCSRKSERREADD